MENKQHWQDWINIILGAWLFVSPFFGFGALNSAAAWNAHIFGAIVVVLSAVALYESQVWEEWINMAIGLWLIFAPLALGFFHQRGAMLNHVDVGLAIFFIALWAAAMHPIRPLEEHVHRAHKA